MSAAALARQLHVPTNRIAAILNGQRAITGDTALRLALQSLYEPRLAEQKVGKSIKSLPTLKPHHAQSVGRLQSPNPRGTARSDRGTRHGGLSQIQIALTVLQWSSNRSCRKGCARTSIR